MPRNDFASITFLPETRSNSPFTFAMSLENLSFIVFLIKITSRSSFAVTKKREITKCYPSLDCLYISDTGCTGKTNTDIYYQINLYFSSIFPTFHSLSTVTIFPSSSQRSCQSFAPGQRNTCPFTRRLFLSSVAIFAISSSVSGSSVIDFKLLT